MDAFDETKALIGLEFPDGSTQSVRLKGPSTVLVDLGSLQDTDNNGREQVPTEMVQLDLAGVSPTLGRVNLTLNPQIPTLGEIEETANSMDDRLDLPPFAPAGTAESFFDVFFQVVLPDQKNLTLVNLDPSRLESTISHKPPEQGNTYMKTGGRIELFDQFGNSTDIFLISADHTPQPPPDAVEIDSFTDTRALIGLDLGFGVQSSILRGPSEVHVFFEGPAEGDAFDDDANLLDEVDTEMVQLDLAGFVNLPPQTILTCSAIGSGGDRADLRGIRFTVSRDLFAVEVRMAGSVAGDYTFDAELRRSTGFAGPADFVASGVTVTLSASSVTPPYTPVLFDVGPVPVSGSETFTLKFTNISGPGLAFFESSGFNDVCADVEETTGNTGTTPTVKGDSPGFRVIGPGDLTPVNLRLNPVVPTLGQIEEDADTQTGRLDLMPFALSGTAQSFFDVFFEVEFPDFGLVLSNQVPSRLEATIDQKPSGNGTHYLKPQGPIDLFDQFGNLQGQLVSARHTPDPVEVDAFPVTKALVGLQFPDGSTQSVRLVGPSTVHVDLGSLQDTDNDGLEQVPTEMVQLDLTGSSPLGQVSLSLNPQIPTIGEIEENANTQANRLDLPPFAPSGDADSFFDVFFEVTVPGIGVLHNQAPSRLESTIAHKPPETGNTYMKTGGAIELFDASGNPTGIFLISADHTPSPAVEVDSFTDTRALVALDILGSGPQSAILRGPSEVHVFFEGPNEGDADDNDGDMLDEVSTEMVQLDLSGSIPGVGPVILRLNPNVKTVGEIEENPAVEIDKFNDTRALVALDLLVGFPRLFAVPDDGSDSIVELNPFNGAELNRFRAPEAVGAGRDGLAFDGRTLYFLNGDGSDMLWELDPDTGVVLDVTPILTGSGEFDGLAALGGNVYILDFALDDILEFEPVSNQITNTLDIDAINLGVSLNGGLAGIRGPNHIVATSNFGTQVFEIDPASGRVRGSFSPTGPLAGRYAGVGVVRNRIYLGSLTAPQIDVYTRGGGFQASLPTGYGTSALGADDLLRGTGPQSAILRGPSEVHVFFEGRNEGDAHDHDGDMLDEVETEMVQLDLTGSIPNVGPVILRLNPNIPTTGLIEENADTQTGRLDLQPFAPSGTAFSLFDVFFEIDVPNLGLTLHNKVASRLQSTISHKPPENGRHYIKPDGSIPLFDRSDNHVGFLVSARHTPDPVEIDSFARTRALVGLRFPDGSTQSVRLVGPSTVHVDLGALQDTDNDGLEQVPTEMVQLDLTGTAPGIGQVNLTLNPQIPTIGEIEENANTQDDRLDLPPFAPTGDAESFFDVFFELEVPSLGLTLFNRDPSRLQSTISHKPPETDNTYSKTAGEIELFDQNGNATGIFLISADHTPRPALPPAVVNHGEGAKAHSIHADASNRFVLAMDLGMDSVFQYVFDPSTGKLSPNDVPAVKAAAGAGPRHLDFHPNGKFAFVIDELDNTMMSFSYDTASGRLSHIKTDTTLPAGFDETSYCADVHVLPSGRFLYGSNRGHHSIAIFKVDAQTGDFAPAGHEPTGGQWPRNFHIDPGGELMLVANQKSDDVVPFRINQENGQLTPTGAVTQVPSPSYVGVVYLPGPGG